MLVQRKQLYGSFEFSHFVVEHYDRIGEMRRDRIHAAVVVFRKLALIWALRVVRRMVEKLLLYDTWFLYMSTKPVMTAPVAKKRANP
jgi:hypothetical protein